MILCRHAVKCASKELYIITSRLQLSSNNKKEKIKTKKFVTLSYFKH